MTDDMASLYQHLDIWVVDALRRRPHPTHMELPAVLNWVERLTPKRTALIHMDNTMDYATLRHELPAGVEPGYDGLVLTA
jgi:phosphoribosyl 1,2-cyclic phosphate phosphodiesterase